MRSGHDAVLGQLQATAIAVVVGSVLYANYVLCGDQFSVLLCSLALCEALQGPLNRLSDQLKYAAQWCEDHSAGGDIWGVRAALAELKATPWKTLKNPIIRRSVGTFLFVAAFRIKPAFALFIIAIVAALLGAIVQIQLWLCGADKRDRLDVRAFKFLGRDDISAVLMMLLILFGSILLASFLVVPAAVDAYTGVMDLHRWSATALTSDAAASTRSEWVKWTLEQAEPYVTDETRSIFVGAQDVCLGPDANRSANVAATVSATYEYLGAQFNATEWWPIAEGVRAQIDNASVSGVEIVNTVRNDVEAVYGKADWWTVAQPFIDSLVVPISKTVLQQRSEDGVKESVGVSALFSSLRDVPVEFFTDAFSKLAWLMTKSSGWAKLLVPTAAKLLSGALVPLVWFFTLIYYFFTLLTSKSKILERVVAALHMGTPDQRDIFTTKVQHLVYTSIYLPFQMSCALSTAALLVLKVFTWIAPVYYINVAVSLTFVLSFFPLLGAVGFVVVVLPWSVAVYLHGGTMNACLAVALFVAFVGVLYSVQSQFLESKQEEIEGHNAVISTVALVLGFTVFGTPGIFVGPFLAGAFLIVAGEIAPETSKRNSYAAPSAETKAQLARLSQRVDSPRSDEEEYAFVGGAGGSASDAPPELPPKMRPKNKKKD